VGDITSKVLVTIDVLLLEVKINPSMVLVS